MLDDTELKGVKVAFTEPVSGAVLSGVTELLADSVCIPDESGLEEGDLVPPPPLTVPCCKWPDWVLPREGVIRPLQVLAS